MTSTILTITRERDSNQALGRRFVLVSSVPVGDGGVGNASHTLLGGTLETRTNLRPRA
jgi:hypothetical protein